MKTFTEHHRSRCAANESHRARQLLKQRGAAGQAKEVLFSQFLFAFSAAVVVVLAAGSSVFRCF